MKKQIFSVAIASLIFAISVAFTQAQSARLIGANIPFNFFVKDRAMPAGEYILEPVQIAGSDALKIQSADGRLTAIVLTRSARGKATQQEPTLIFNRFGEQYFLSQVTGFERNETLTLPKSSAAERLAKDGGAAKREPVSVNGNRR